MFWHFNINKGQDNNSITKGNATTAIKKDTVILNALGQQTRIREEQRLKYQALNSRMASTNSQ